MLVTKNEAKKASKKVLSVFLAVIMIMSSMSVCFGNLGLFASAANDTGAVSAFIAAAKCDALKNGNFEITQSGRTYTFTVKSYAHYVQLDNVIDKLDAAIKGLDEYKNNAHHNNNKNCADAWYGGDNCTDLGWIEKYLKLAIGDSELATLNGTYNLEKLFAAVFNMTDMNYRNADTKDTDDKDDTKTESNVPEKVTNTLIVTSSKVHDKLLEYSSISAIPDNFALKTTYTLNMFRQNFTTTEKSGCDDVTVNHYHIAMNTNKTGGVPSISVVDGSSQKAVLTSAETVFANNVAYINTADVNAVLALSQDADALALIEEAIETAKNSVINAHGEAVYNHFFDEVQIAKGLKNIDDAIKFLGFKVTVDELNRLNAIDYSSYTEAQLLTHLTTFEAEIAKFDALEEATRNLIISSFGLDIDGIRATCADVRHDYEVIGIVRAKAQADTHYNMYKDYTIEMVDDGTIVKADITGAVATIGNDIAEFGKYVQAYVVEVCGATYLTTLGALKTKLEKLGIAAGYNAQFLYEYAKYRDEIRNAVSEDSETLVESLINYDSWFTGLKNLIDDMKTDLGNEIADMLFDDLNEPMVEYMNNAYVVLNLRTEGQINTAYDLYTAYKKANGEKITMATVSDYKALTNSIGLIDKTAYDFLKATPNFTISQDAVNKYNELMSVDFGYAEFLASFGFSTFQTSAIADLVREDTTDDIARKNADIDGDGIGEYKTKDSDINDVIKVLDAALTNPAVTGLLGFDLGTKLNDLVKGAIMTDSFINTVVQMLYPLVLKEFGKVFENELPEKVTDPIEADVNYNMNIHGVLQNTGFEIYPGLLADVLDKDMYSENIKMLDAAQANFDKEFGVSTGGKAYTTVLDPEGGVKADKTTPRTILDKTAWDSQELFKVVVGEDGNPVLNEDGTPKKEFALTWGVDAAKAKVESGEMTQANFETFFYNAFDDAVEGLKPLLLALIANKMWDPSEIASFASASIATVSLKLSATQNRGYANLLVPIYEALGVPFDAPSVIENDHIKETNDVAAILRSILTPIFTFINNIGNAPLDTILGVLPNVFYALSAQMVNPLLSMLKTSIAYAATPKAACVSLDPITGGADVDVGSMLKLEDMGVDLSDGINSILKGFGVDIPAINQGLVATLGELQTRQNSKRGDAIYKNFHTFAGYEKDGEGKDILTKPIYKDYTGEYYHIEANKADVLLYLVDYLLEALKTPGFLDMIGGLFGGAEEAPAEGEDTTAPEAPEAPAEGEEKVDILTTILDNIKNDPDAAIAGIVELFNLGTYNTLESYNWYSGYVDNQQVGTLTGTPAYEIYMNPGNDWTKDKAQYLYNNIDAIVASVLSLAGLDLDENAEGAQTDLNAFIDGAIGGLLSDKTLTDLAALLAGLDLNALLAGDKDEAEGEDGEATPDEPEVIAEGDEAEEETEAPALDINGLLRDLLGIDLSSFATTYADIVAGREADENYVYNFGVDAGTTTFASALATMLAPFDSVLNFIFRGSNLVANLDVDGENDLVIPGYDGYTNAIVPLLEALGCNVSALGENDKVLEVIVGALESKIAAITANGAVKGIIDILPGVFYFLAGNNLATVVRNLLQPVYVILDTIRPIYDVDLAALIAGIEIGEEGNKKPLGLDLDILNLNTIFDLLEELLLADVDLGTLLDDVKQLIYDVCKVANIEYTSLSALANSVEKTEGEATVKVAKKGAYNANLDQADLLTVLLSFVLEWATVPANAAKLDELLGTNGIIAALKTVFADASSKINYETPNWAYWFPDEAAFEAYLAGEASIPNTLATIDWEAIEGNNDWDREAAQYFADNIGELVDAVIAMINKDKADAPKNLADLLNGLVYDNLGGYFTDETINDLLDMIKGVLANVDDALLDVGYELLNVDLAGLKAYTCDKEINDLKSFVDELAFVLDTYAAGLIDLLFFGDDFRIAKKSDRTDTIVINGGLGYEKGLALILEALGCDLPVIGEKNKAAAVLGALVARIEAILADPVNKILDLLPNLIYFLNANGAGVAVNNLLQPVYALIDKINALGLMDPIDLKALVGINLAELSLANVVEIVEGATGLKLDAAEAILVNFCTGKITNKNCTYIYKMDAERKDVITILLYVALELISDEEFAAQLDEMLGTDFIAQIKSVFEGKSIEYVKPDWNYNLAVNGTVDAMKYSITYPTNWSEATAKYVTELVKSEEFDKLIAGLIDKNYASLSDLLNDKVNVFTADTLNSLLEFIKGFLGGIDSSLLELGFILDVDLNGLMNHPIPADIDTVEEFAAELAIILNAYAKGVVEWLLLGRDFKLLVKDADGIGAALDGEAYITINGAEGYANGLALLLEALGCENLPAADAETDAIVTGVLTSLANRINAIFADPVDEVINLLPNLLYFLNTNGVAAVVKNTTAALTALVAKLEVFGIELDLNELVNLKKLMKIEDTDAKISLDNLTVEALLEAVSYMVEGLDLTLVKDVLVNFGLVKANAYTPTVSDATAVGVAKKMGYEAGVFEAHDMVTVLANIVLLTIADEDNAEFVKGLVGEDIYKVILNLLNMSEAEIKEFSWMYKDRVGETFTTLETSDLYNDWPLYGPFYTEEMAAYIADNFGEFVDNILYLLGLEINGVQINTLTQLINELLDGSLYNSSNIIAIRDALAGVLANVEKLEVKGVVVGGYIADVLKTAGVADIKAVAAVEVPEFEKNKEQFVASLCDVLEPLYGILKYVLANQDISFFVDLDKSGLITLKGGEGYRYGIIPLLEVLGCENILTPDAYYAAIKAGDNDTLITSILTPLLARVDKIIENPANEILGILPNLFYFINSNGLDTVVKNTLNAVYSLLGAIEPVAKIDIYELIGVDLAEINMNWLVDKLLGILADAGYDFKAKDLDPIAELTIGTLEKYDSLSGKEAYRMVYTPDGGIEGGKKELVTVILRLLVTFLMHEKNAEIVVDFFSDNLGMSADAKDYLTRLIKSIAAVPTTTYLGMDQALAVIYYLFYSADIGAGETVQGFKDIGAEWGIILNELGGTAPDTIGGILNDLLGDDVIDSDRFAPSGLIGFFHNIINWFNKIINWFKNLFN